jgi:demethylmenaquinone methyltransferase/2-methoxy-6-polyprenyl-1,4-benzoquinol methylase
MSSLVLMRILESVPARYDRGMQLLTLGGWRRGHRALAERAVPAAGARVLELGCGTGALTEQLLARDARVVAIDQNPEMLDRARERLGQVEDDRLELVECTAAEIDRFGEASFDAVAASLVLSEMSASERGYVLKAVARALRPGGVVVIGDEVVPRGALARALHAIVRWSLALLAWVVTGSITRPLPDLEGELEGAGLRVRAFEPSRLGTWALAVAERT